MNKKKIPAYKKLTQESQERVFKDIDRDINTTSGFVKFYFQLATTLNAGAILVILTLITSENLDGFWISNKDILIYIANWYLVGLALSLIGPLVYAWITTFSVIQWNDDYEKLNYYEMCQKILYTIANFCEWSVIIIFIVNSHTLINAIKI